jgi:hypothetical protein
MAKPGRVNDIGGIATIMLTIAVIKNGVTLRMRPSPTSGPLAASAMRRLRGDDVVTSQLLISSFNRMSMRLTVTSCNRQICRNLE